MNYFLVGLIFMVSGCSHFSEKKTEEVKVETVKEVNFDQLWNYGDPAGTREKFRDLLSSESEYSVNWRLQLQTQVARTFSLQAQFKEAHSILDQVFSQRHLWNNLTEIRYLLERGRTYNSSGKKAEALEHFQKAYQVGKDTEFSSLTIDAAHMVAIASGSLEEKVKWNQFGLEKAITSTKDQDRRWIGAFYNNMGWDYFEQKVYDKALEQFRLGVEHHRQKGNLEQRSIAEWSVAKTLRLQGHLDDALKIQLRLLDEKKGQDSSGYIFEELGELYFSMKSPEYKTYFKRAHEILSKDTWLVRNEKGRLDRLDKLSKD